MTQDIIRMAREAGGGTTWWPLHTDTLKRFAALVAAAEREACGRVKAKPSRQLKPVGTGALLDEQQYCFSKGWREGAASVRAAIRARGQA
jgi:hypothetical protein